MRVKDIKNLETCTATDIIDYFEDIIGNDFEDLVYSSYNKKSAADDKAYIDSLMEKRSLEDEKEKKQRRADVIYDIMKKSPNNNSYSFKTSLLSKIYTRYFQILSQPENSKKMKK